MVTPHSHPLLLCPHLSLLTLTASSIIITTYQLLITLLTIHHSLACVSPLPSPPPSPIATHSHHPLLTLHTSPSSLTYHTPHPSLSRQEVCDVPVYFTKGRRFHFHTDGVCCSVSESHVSNDIRDLHTNEFTQRHTVVCRLTEKHSTSYWFSWRTPYGCRENPK